MTHDTSKPAKTISLTTLVKRTGLGRRQLAREAAAGKIPGVERRDGLHFTFPDSPALRRWIASRRTLTKMRHRGAGAGPTAGLTSLKKSTMDIIRRTEEAVQQFEGGRWESQVPWEKSTVWKTWVQHLDALVDLYSWVEDRCNIPKAKRRVVPRPGKNPWSV